MSGGGSKRKIILDPSASQLSSSRKARGAESSDLLHSRGGRSSGGDKRASEGGRHGAKDSRDSRFATEIRAVCTVLYAKKVVNLLPCNYARSYG